MPLEIKWYAMLPRWGELVRLEHSLMNWCELLWAVGFVVLVLDIIGRTNVLRPIAWAAFGISAVVYWAKDDAAHKRYKLEGRDQG
jgi:hypothetical protein